MDKMAIKGGAQLTGSVSASGAKNAALPVIFSCLLAPGKFRLTNIPHLRDIQSTEDLMASLGCKTALNNHELVIDVPEKAETTAHYDLVRKMRASILVLGPLLARFGEAKVSLPGGCAIGARPINFHLEALEKMGAKIKVDSGYVHANCKKLQGTSIRFPFASVGGTENIMMAACLADGETTLHNAAKEPEIEDLADILQKMGAKIEGAGTETLRIHGVESLNAAEHSVIADRIEAGTLLIAGAITGGEVTVKDCRPDDLLPLLQALEAAGMKVNVGQTDVTVKSSGGINPVDIITETHPGFPTDLQAQFMALMTQADGRSKITENVFENRFMHVQELARMNAKIEIQGKTAIVDGTPGELDGAPVMATDLRASASLVLAGLTAKGETHVQRIYHLERGYENLDQKLSSLGGQVRRVKG